MNLFESNIFTLIYTCLVIGLIVLFFLSFTLFLRRLLQSSAAKKTTSDAYESEARSNG
ncbi:Uncharacterized protein BCINRASA_01961 [Bacillus wiedmannii]|nr:Uncharacterized protein BCINRASA_01961 [Bacillus wiedmannii]